MRPTLVSPEELAVIRKRGWPDGVRPNLENYERETAGFSWDTARSQLDGLPGGALNITHEAVDRHVADRGDHVALRCVGPTGTSEDLTYGDLSKATSRFANVLDLLGVDRGERVFSLLGRQPELYITALGTLKHGSVFCPVFAAFGPEPVIQRLLLGNAKVLVTTASMYGRKIAPQRHLLPELAEVLLVDDPTDQDRPGTLSLHSLLAQVGDEFATVSTAPGDMALLHFTSGTTGAPKGAIHVHEAVVGHHVTAGYALDLHPDDVFWCTADPGWVTGTSYGIIAPLSHGVTAIVDQGEFDARRWYSILEEQEVTIWYTAPTAIRMLMRAGPEAVEGHDLSKLRFIASVGEPLGADAVRWGEEVLGRPK